MSRRSEAMIRQLDVLKRDLPREKLLSLEYIVAKAQELISDQDEEINQRDREIARYQRHDRVPTGWRADLHGDGSEVTITTPGGKRAIITKGHERNGHSDNVLYELSIDLLKPHGI